MVDFVEYPELIDYLKERFGESLQSVGYYDAGTEKVRLLHLRHDIQEFQDDQEFQDMAMELIDELGHYMDVESWHRMGSLNCIIRAFDYSIFLIIPTEEGKSIAVTLDPDAEIPNPLIGFVQDVRKNIE